jgi:hypothetical protein
MVIHTAMRLQRWEPLCRAFDVVVPEIIAGETKFFDDADRRRTYVTLESAQTVSTASVRSTATPWSPVSDQE